MVIRNRLWMTFIGAMSFFLVAFTGISAAPIDVHKAPTATKKAEQAGPKRSDNTARDIMIVVDNSGSMKHNDPSKLAKEAVADFGKDMGSRTRIGLVMFGQNSELLMSLSGVSTPDYSSKLNLGLSKIDYSGQWTNIPAGIERAIYELKTNGAEKARKAIVFMTDGITDLPDRSQIIEKNRWLKEELLIEAKNRNIRIFGIAFTDSADFELIQALSTGTGGEYCRIAKADELPAAFNAFKAALYQSWSGKSPLDNLGVSSFGALLGIIFAGVMLMAFVAAILWLAWQRTKKRTPVAYLEDIDGQKKQPVRINKRVFKIGRSRKNNLSIDKDSVSEFHAIIEYRPDEDGFYIKDLRSSNKSFVNNKETKEERLKSSDTIGLGSYSLRFKRPGESGLPDKNGGKAIVRTILTPDAMRQQQEGGLPLQAMLVDIKGNAPQRSYKLTKTITAIGRSTHENDIIFPDTQISSYHCEIGFENGNFYIKDKKSSSGTCLDSETERLKPWEKVSIKWGNEIILANKYRFRLSPSELFKPVKTILATPIRTDGTANREEQRTMAGVNNPVGISPQMESEKAQSISVCPNHPEHKSDRTCAICGKAFCGKCVDDYGKGYICFSCKKNIDKKAPVPENDPVPKPEAILNSGNTAYSQVASQPQDPTVAPGGYDGKTIQKPLICPRHPENRPKYFCSLCRRPCCDECITGTGGKLVCTDCLNAEKSSDQIKFSDKTTSSAGLENVQTEFQPPPDAVDFDEAVKKALEIIDAHVILHPVFQVNGSGDAGLVMQAAEHFKQAYSARKNDPSVYFAFIASLRLASQFKQADDELKELLKLFPDFAPAHYASQVWKDGGVAVPAVFAFPEWTAHAQALPPFYAEKVHTFTLFPAREGFHPRAVIFEKDGEGWWTKEKLNGIQVEIAVIFVPGKPNVAAIYRRCTGPGLDKADIQESLAVLDLPRDDISIVGFEYLCEQDFLDVVIVNTDNSVLLNRRINLSEDTTATLKRCREVLMNDTGRKMSNQEMMQALQSYQQTADLNTIERKYFTAK